jgi:hypothetical protein
MSTHTAYFFKTVIKYQNHLVEHFTRTLYIPEDLSNQSVLKKTKFRLYLDIQSGLLCHAFDYAKLLLANEDIDVVTDTIGRYGILKILHIIADNDGEEKTLSAENLKNRSIEDFNIELFAFMLNEETDVETIVSKILERAIQQQFC